MPKATAKFIPVSKVQDSNTKIKFKLVLEGEWDWNQDFTSGHSEYDAGVLEEYQFRDNSNLEFRAAFQKYIAARVFDRCDNMFNTATVTEFLTSKEVLAAYADWQSKVRTKQADAAQAEVEAAEQALAAAKARAKMVR